MQFTRTGKFIKAVRCADDDRRRHGRLRCEGTRSTLGRVIDLSLSGMQVTRRGGRIVDIGDEFFVELRWDKVALPLKARVVRVTKSGFGRYTLRPGVRRRGPGNARATHLHIPSHHG